MADGRQRAEWVRTASLAAMIGGLFKGVDPARLIPRRYLPRSAKPRSLTPEEQAVETKVFFAALGQYLAQMNRGR